MKKITKRSEFTRKQMAQAMLDCKGICKLCDEKIIGKVEYHHGVPDWKCKRSNQKSNTQSNCVPVHPECHRIFTNSDAAERAKWDRQVKKFNGERQTGAVRGSRPTDKKSQWQKQKFQKPPKGYNSWKR